MRLSFHGNVQHEELEEGQVMDAERVQSVLDSSDEQYPRIQPRLEHERYQYNESLQFSKTNYLSRRKLAKICKSELLVRSLLKELMMS
jgi:hypothetical protein